MVNTSELRKGDIVHIEATVYEETNDIGEHSVIYVTLTGSSREPRSRTPIAIFADSVRYHNKVMRVGSLVYNKNNSRKCHIRMIENDLAWVAYNGKEYDTVKIVDLSFDPPTKSTAKETIDQPKIEI